MRRMISRKWVFSLYILLLFSGSFSSYASAKPPKKFISGIASNAISAIFKWLWSLKPTNKISLAIPSRSMMKFESGYTVETVFDGSKLGIEPYSVEVTPSGELLVLDSQNSNIHKVSTPLSKYSVPKLVAGSYEGYSGHVDGKLKESKMNHPKGLTVDDRGNIYVADTKNMAIRKISDSGVVTIAGGNWARGSGHIDGPSDTAKFSNDFDLLYVASTCSILVVDRGNQAIREIQLHEDDCSFDHFNGNLLSGTVVLIGAVFFGFMLALLQRRISDMVSSPTEPRSPIKMVHHPSSHQTPFKSVRPPLIPPENNDPKNEEDSGIFKSLEKLYTNTKSSLSEIIHPLFSSSKKKPPTNTYQTIHHQPPPYFNTWPMQQTYIIPPQYPPPFIGPTRKPHKLTTKNPRHFNKNRHMYHGHNNKHFMSGPQTYYEENTETTNEVVFGAVQEQDRTHGPTLIKAIDYSNQSYNTQDLRYRYNNYMGYG
ncbi:hypothetical protein LXL04_023999 [Taraxacum kok-saghyz]